MNIDFDVLNSEIEILRRRYEFIRSRLGVLPHVYRDVPRIRGAVPLSEHLDDSGDPAGGDMPSLVG